MPISGGYLCQKGKDGIPQIAGFGDHSPCRSCEETIPFRIVHPTLNHWIQQFGKVFWIHLPITRHDYTYIDSSIPGPFITRDDRSTYPTVFGMANIGYSLFF